MPLPRKLPVDLTPSQALYVLERLVRDRVVSRAEVHGYVSDLGAEIAAIEARLYALHQAAGDGAPRDRGESAAASHAAPARARRTSHARHRSSRGKGVAGKQLGGRFAGLIRRLPVDERAQYHEIKAKEGVEAAISALQKRRSAAS